MVEARSEPLQQDGTKNNPIEPWVVPDGTVATGLELMLEIFLNKFDPGSDLILGWI